MATILLAAAGAAVGSGFGGTVLGLSGAVIGRAVGATIGRSLDQRILGSGSDAVEVGKIDRFRLSGVGYGTPIQEVWGRMRVAGQIIWASRFQEQRQQSGGGKGAPKPVTTTFSYTVSLAIALCRGEALRIGRVWADGVEISANSLDLRFYPGSEDQLPDPKIEAVEGAGFAPSYRGMAYAVIEDLPLARFGNRVPQFSFEVVRRANVEGPHDLVDEIKAVAMIPGSGEYALATTPVHFNHGPGVNVSANVHSLLGETDFSSSLKQLNEELPNCGSVSLGVSWFGNDLRCGTCQVRPKVEQTASEGVEMSWIVSGTTRSAAAVVPAIAGRAVYGGTPSDRSVIEAIQALHAAGKEVMFYPFILMDQLAGNVLADPWSDAVGQPPLPWRGRITLSNAPGQAGSPDQTATAGDEVAAFLGTASAAQFVAGANAVSYVGTPEWSYRRFILHYAHLCALAGGVDAFCIGSELRGLTEIRSSATVFPMVQALKGLAAEVRSILGTGVEISYAADWSEYFGLQRDGDVLFNLDPLWADPNIDFIGIDNYMPLSDWRDGAEHEDAAWSSIYDLDYLMANIAGGEGYEWYYASPEAEANQARSPIVDGAYGEDWIFRYKDIKGWWSHDHHERLGGVRQAAATDWVPGMKPIRFTEYGCAALDKATNQPNKFLDPKSSESSLPRGSNGLRDDYLQMRYYLAMGRFWRDAANNPEATSYAGHMVDFDRSHAWAWDARPFPDFPGSTSVWDDGVNYAKGHWLNGRCSNQPLAAVVAEISSDAGLGPHLDTSALHGTLHGFASSEAATARSKLQTLAMVHGFDAAERHGTLAMFNRGTSPLFAIDPDWLVATKDAPAALEQARAPVAETVDRVRLTYVEAENDFEALVAETSYPGDGTGNAVESEVPVQLTAAEANAIVDRCLAESRLSRDKVQLSLPKSRSNINAGDVIQIVDRTYRVDRVEDADAINLDAVRVDNRSYLVATERGEMPRRVAPAPATPVYPLFMDLPLLRGDEVAQAPHVAIAANPWPGTVSVWSSSSESGFAFNTEVQSPSIIGTTLTELRAAQTGLFDRGSALRVTIPTGTLSTSSALDVLNGTNVAAIGDGSAENWEILQFSGAALVAANTYELTDLLRGLAGSDALAPTAWPEGSVFVLLETLGGQINLPMPARGLERFYRIGASELGYSDPSVVSRVDAFRGIGLRPYSVGHLSGHWDPAVNLTISWIRRTRMDGDSWESVEVPLGEEAESYTLQVIKDNILRREVTVSAPLWTYSLAMQTTDLIATPFEVRVAQNSASFGAGPFRSVTIP